MKYIVTACIDEDKTYRTTVSVRRGAKMKTVFINCMNEIGQNLIRAKVIDRRAGFKFDLPNIWTNGYVGAAWFISPFINVTIQEETGAWLAI